QHLQGDVAPLVALGRDVNDLEVDSRIVGAKQIGDEVCLDECEGRAAGADPECARHVSGGAASTARPGTGREVAVAIGSPARGAGPQSPSAFDRWRPSNPSRSLVRLNA